MQVEVGKTCITQKKALLQIVWKGIQGIFCVWLLMDMTAFPGPIFKSRTIFGNDFSSSFQIWGQNFKFQMFRVRKSWKTFLSRRLICCVRLLMDMTAFPGPIFKSRTIFGNYFPSCFQIWGLNFKFLTFRVCKSWKTLLFRRLINCVRSRAFFNVLQHLREPWKVIEHAKCPRSFYSILKHPRVS